MSLIFTEHVRSMDGERGLTTEAYEAVLPKLRTALRREMKKRSLWRAPPSFLGVCGCESWQVKEAFEELLLDCYCFVFIRRLSGLKAFLELQENIEGKVFLNIRHFLFEKQKQHDPLGYRVFDVLRRAVRQSISTGGLFVLAGNDRVGNATILALSAAADRPQAHPEDLTAPARVWSDQLLPELMTARGSRLDAVIGKICRFLANLSNEGIERFRFKNLIDAFKQAVRQRWHAIWLKTQGEVRFGDDDAGFTHVVWLVRPDSGFEERDVFGKLLACVAAALEQLDTRPKTRAYLEKLWVFLRSHAAEDDPDVQSSDKLPSLRKIAKLLDLPRKRLPELLATLGRLVEDCRQEKKVRHEPT